MNYDPNWDLIVDRAVEKQLKQIPKKTAERLLLDISKLSINPYAGNIEKVRGEENERKIHQCH